MPKVITIEQLGELAERLTRDVQYWKDRATKAEGALDEVIKGWDSLPGPRRYTIPEVQKWLLEDMHPAIGAARSVMEGQLSFTLHSPEEGATNDHD